MYVCMYVCMHACMLIFICPLGKSSNYITEPNTVKSKSRLLHYRGNTNCICTISPIVVYCMFEMHTQYVCYIKI
jgi:hypothetical protein